MDLSVDSWKNIPTTVKQLESTKNNNNNNKRQKRKLFCAGRVQFRTGV